MKKITMISIILLLGTVYANEGRWPINKFGQAIIDEIVNQNDDSIKNDFAENVSVTLGEAGATYSKSMDYGGYSQKNGEIYKLLFGKDLQKTFSIKIVSFSEAFSRSTKKFMYYGKTDSKKDIIMVRCVYDGYLYSIGFLVEDHKNKLIALHVDEYYSYGDD